MKRFSRFCTILVCLLLVMNLGVTAFAEGNVTYDTRANEFIFEPGSDYSPTDLFSDLKNVMPGDTISQEILIRNHASSKDKVRVYLRSLGAQEETDEFLSQLKLTVTQKTNTTRFEAAADETAQLTEWTYLGTIYPGDKITLNLTLEVPITMGNEFQNQAGFIDWKFMVVEIPIDPDQPATGDGNDLLLYGGLMVASIGALIILVMVAVRRKREEEA